MRGRPPKNNERDARIVARYNELLPTSRSANKALIQIGVEFGLTREAAYKVVRTKGSRSMKVFGLTGGIACGKSTVAKEFKSLGATVIGADEIARTLVVPGAPAYNEILITFPFLRCEDGPFDRLALGKWVFQHPEELAKLNAIMLPRIAEESRRGIEEARTKGAELVIYEAALLTEVGTFDGLIEVQVSEHLQLLRLRERNGFDEASARERITVSRAIVRKPTHVIENCGNREHLQAATHDLYERLTGRLG
jgi:dephospho-CoA kinase